MVLLKALDGSEIPIEAWDLHEQKVLKRFLRDGDSILQIGANIGTGCVTASKNHKLKRNVCVEANKDIIQTLESNVKKYAPNAEIIHGTITDDKNKVFMHVEGGNNADYGQTREDPGGMEVPRVPFSTITEGKIPFNVLYADCQGCFPLFIKEYCPTLDLMIFDADADKDYSNVIQCAEGQGLKRVYSKGEMRVYSRRDEAKG